MEKIITITLSILIMLTILVPRTYAAEDGIFYNENTIAGKPCVLTIPMHSLSIPKGFEIGKIETSCDCLSPVWDVSFPADFLKLHYMVPSFSGNYTYEIIITSNNRNAPISRITIPMSVKVIDAIAVSPASLDIILDGQNRNYSLELTANDKKDFRIKRVDTDSSAITVSYPNELGSNHKLQVKLSSAEELSQNKGKLKVITDCQQIIIPYRFIARHQLSPAQLVFVDVAPGEKYAKQLQISNAEKLSSTIKHHASESGYFDISQQSSGKLSIELRIAPSEKRRFLADILEFTFESGEKFQIPCYVWMQKQNKESDHLAERDSLSEITNSLQEISDDTSFVNPICEPIHLSSRSIHLPYMRQGKVYQFRETVTNQGNENYHLNIRTGCSSCSTTKLTPSGISPGRTAELLFSIFKAEPGDFTLTLWVYQYCPVNFG